MNGQVPEEPSPESSARIPFPQQFSRWEQGCFLYEPQNGVLSRESSQSTRFSLSVPSAEQVDLLVAGRWITLRESAGLWSAQVSLSDLTSSLLSTNSLQQQQSLGVFAHFAENKKGQSSQLLEFSFEPTL